MLIHCDAGRDRSGAVSALLIAMAAEKSGLLDERMISAIECDYRKTQSLIEDKYGRMSNFIRNLKNIIVLSGAGFSIYIYYHGLDQI